MTIALGDRIRVTTGPHLDRVGTVEGIGAVPGFDPVFEKRPDWLVVRLDGVPPNPFGLGGFYVFPPNQVERA